ncbi:MAG: RluA family pseudouridine synthase [Peptostreptococcaceae bacterium]|nr:RluA family pseudouridine synthase [Peptostreptococcaceae bacterium]
MIREELQKYNKIVYENKDKKELKTILKDEINLSSRLINKLKKNNKIFVNNKKRKLDDIIKKNDIVEIILEEEKNEYDKNKMNLNIIYEDYDLLILNKEPYIVVHPTKSHKNETIANGLCHYLYEDKKENCKIRFINRLDMNTSGLLIIGKNSYAQHILSLDMKEDKVEKKYYALVHGNLKEKEFKIDKPIYKDEDSIKRVVDKRGQRCITNVKVVEEYNNYSLLELGLETGRTHQIRVHLSHIGNPIVGDELYGKENDDLMKRQALHAYYLKFLRPRTKEILELKVELPKDIKNAINKIKNDN